MRTLQLSFLILHLLTAAPVCAAETKTGEQIYRKQCASCHGAQGEGTKDNYPRALTGNRSVAQLAKLIAKTMPDNAPGTCVGDDADKVAAYIHDAFYSKTARERNRPARIELARLTVRQYRNTLADLIGSFRGSETWSEKRGLQAEYFSGRRFNNRQRVLERVDPEVQFDFGTASPVADKIEPHEFLIRWSGSVLAPETGEYEFIIRTEHAARLWVNDRNRPLIDAWVKSGKDTEYRGSITLIAGRVYPLRLEYAKAKQGVDDSKTNKTKPPPVKSSITLEWKPPQRGSEVIPARNLSPGGSPESFAVTTAFPPDDRSYGWVRGTTVSRAWDQATTDAALETADYVSAHLAELSGVRDDASDRGPRLREFCRRFAERAFRRPLTDEQKRVFIDRSFDASRDVETAVKRVVLFVLKSPRFLYREVGASSDAYDVAARLSFGLWDSLPDKELLDAAAAGKLVTREQIVRQAERMLKDLRARAKLRDFFGHWLRIDQAPDLTKDSKRFPDFNAAVVSDLRQSLDYSLDEVVEQGADFRQLFLSDHLYLNGRLAKFYGADVSVDGGFQKVKLNPEHRAGLLTHPYMLAAFAYTGESSPIHRGVFVARNILGVSLRPPPEAVVPLPANLHPKLTTRERVGLQTQSATCMTCHGVINPLGFTLENFDAVGRFRDKERDKAIDATGLYQTRTGKTVTFAGARDLARFLADSEDVQDAFVEQLFHDLVQQSIRAYGPKQLAELRRAFVANKFSVQKVAVEIVASSALVSRETKVGR
jgi:cytochrome c553